MRQLKLPANDAPADLTPIIGANLRRLRTARGLSLQELADKSGVSRAMLSQIELERSAPTINLVWKIAHALQVQFSALLGEAAAPAAVVLEARHSKVLASRDGGFSSRALFPFDEPRFVEFYELRLRARAEEHAEAHAAGTFENLVVAEGALALTVGDKHFSLTTGDAIRFAADVPHAYRNPGKKAALVYLVMTYAEKKNG